MATQHQKRAHRALFFSLAPPFSHSEIPPPSLKAIGTVLHGSEVGQGELTSALIYGAA